MLMLGRSLKSETAALAAIMEQFELRSLAPGAAALVHPVSYICSGSRPAAAAAAAERGMFSKTLLCSRETRYVGPHSRVFLCVGCVQADRGYTERPNHAGGSWASSGAAVQPQKKSSHPQRDSSGHTSESAQTFFCPQIRFESSFLKRISANIRLPWKGK